MLLVKINHILLILLPYISFVVLFTHPEHSNVKRFTLQDLLSTQGTTQLAAQQPVTEDSSAKTQTVDIQTLLAAAQKVAAANQQQPSSVETSQFLNSNNNNKPVDIDVAADRNGNINLADLPGLQQAKAVHNGPETNTNVLSLNDLQSLIAKQTSQQAPAINSNVVKEELDLGKEKVELESAGKRATRYALAKGPDGGLNLVPVVEGAPQLDGNKFQMLQPKGFEEKGSNRQQMQLTTLSQALYSPFPSDQNTLHLHLKGKDGKDGKPGNKGPMGTFGPKGPEGPKGGKGDAGTCSSQINGLFECTPDELDSLSNRVDYLEKICHKVESGAKKHKIHFNVTKSENNEESKEHHDERHKENNNNNNSNEKEAEHVKEKDDNKSDKEKEDTKEEHAKVKTESKETKEKESAKESKQVEKDEKENESSKITESKNEERGEKKHFTNVKNKPYQDSSSAALKSMIDIRAKLRISELDILDRIKQAKEGTMKTL